MSTTTLHPTSIADVQAMSEGLTNVYPYAGGSKNALASTSEAVTPLSLAALNDVLEYDPGEYTFTALAGTPIQRVEQRLAEYGQYLPVDPLLVERGAA